MKSSNRYFLILLSGAILVLSTPSANSRATVPPATNPHQIVVLVHQSDKGLRFELGSGEYKNGEYKKGDANYLLAELKLHEGGDCQIIEIVDDRAPLSAITQVSEMAINAGFKDVRLFVHWHKTGNIAQVQFGPVFRFTKNADKLAERADRVQ